MNTISKHNNFNKQKSLLILSDQMVAGGMERQIIELMAGLKKERKYIIVLAILDHFGEREDEAKEFSDFFIPIKRMWRYDFFCLFGLIRTCKRNNIDIIHTFGWMSGLFGLIASNILKIPIVNGAIRNAPIKLTFRQKISRFCMLKSDAVVANSFAGLDAYDVKKLPTSLMILNGVNFKRFELQSIKANKNSICMVANFSWHKDHASLIRTIPILKRKFPYIKLVLVGRDRGTLDLTKSLVKKLSLENNIDFIVNSLNPEPIIASSTVCVLLSNKNNAEGISNSIIEYMALGKPVLATDCGGTNEIIENGINGFLVDNKIETLATIIDDLFKNYQLRLKVGTIAKSYAWKKFHIDRMIAEYELLYDCLTSRKVNLKECFSAEKN